MTKPVIKSFIREKLAAKYYINLIIVLMKKNDPRGLSAPAPGLYTFYKVYINDDPGLTLTYLRKGQIGSPVHLNGAVIKSINGEKLAAKDYID